MITEVLQDVGSFEINLKDDTPLYIRESIPYQVAGKPYGHIVVTPQRLPVQSFSVATLLSLARWTGRIQGLSNRMHQIAGHGLGAWIGDADDKGNLVVAYGGGAATTMTAAVTDVLVSHGYGNGITLGSTAADTGTTIATSFAEVSVIALLNQYADATDNAWRINPDGTLDLGAPASLFNGIPTVILLDGEGGSDSTTAGLFCADLDVAEDFDDYATYCFVNGTSPFTGSATIASPPKDFGGTDPAVIEVRVDGEANSGAACNSTATNYLNLHKTTRREVTASVQDIDDVGHYLRPGDQVYLYEPECGLIDLTKQVPYLGRILPPATALLRAMTWPVVEGMGVYTIQTQDGSMAVVDLTDWIEWEDGSTRLEMGAPSRPAAQPTHRPFGSRTA